MTEYSRMVKGYYTVASGTLGVSAPPAKIINLPFKPDYVEIKNLTQTATPAVNGVISAYWDANATPVTITSVQYDTFLTLYGAGPALTTDSVVVGGGISAFSAGQLLQFGPTLTVTTFDKTTNVVTTTTSHNLATGDVVIFEGVYQDATTGMPQINGLPFTVTVTGATTFTIEWNLNQSNYTSITAGGTGFVRVKKVLYPYIYFPGVSFISAITLGTTTTIDTTHAHNLQVGQEVAFRIPSLWGTVELNSLPNTLTPGAPVYGYVTAVTDYNTVVVNINSSAMTPFATNLTFAQSVSGLTFPQMVAVGDVNTGGILITAGKALYPPPYYRPIGTTTVDTINGPAIRGAFVNNTSQGFVIGNTASRVNTTSWIGGSSGDIIEWRAFLHDMTIPTTIV